MSGPGGDLWVFGYGSLMWRPGFVYEEARHARLVGYRRSFCIYSVHHRGTPQRPGLVLGLDRGGACEGIALRVAAARADATRSYLQAREQIYGVYRGVHANIALHEEPRRDVTALAFVAERAHANYARLLPPVQAELIRGARGVSGTNLVYFANTLRHLAALGIRERALERLMVLVGPHACRRAGGDRVSASAAGMIAALRLRPAPGGRPRVNGHQPFGYRLRLAENG